MGDRIEINGLDQIFLTGDIRQNTGNLHQEESPATGVFCQVETTGRETPHNCAGHSIVIVRVDLPEVELQVEAESVAVETEVTAPSVTSPDG